MPNQHKHHPISVRLPGADRAWVLDQHEKTGRAVNAIIVEAVAEKRERQSVLGDESED